MNLRELKSGQGKVDVEVTVKSKGEARSFNKYGKDLRVCNFVVTDADGGEIKLSLWNADIDKVIVGSVLKITNGYVSEFNGELQLTTGKFGALEVVSGGAASADASTPPSSSKPTGMKEKKGKKQDSMELDEEVF